ncbi:uncharacterized protein EV420DRAFT_1472972 [Desarmillaria tabescens]|uniref:Uncharacterized protein n=1 Tax=Armillaria tabescens TaxID=1929756 RepID=A0AA39T7H0_ARMTA|nr:uncharacterized protein EV420DRAFT_1472972 [Desarmillaria tabescens]KAK0469811.1 hypothetical protein EV420DRAFT_1472972 [Desarmillaria tabescens]
MDRCLSSSKVDIDVETGAQQCFAEKQGDASVSPPPYEYQEPPPYSSITAPACMSYSSVQYLCLFGFLFPPSWIIRALALLSPLHQILPWMFSSKPEALIPNEGLLRRKTEMKWASTCLILISLFSLIGTIVFIVRITAKDAS